MPPCYIQRFARYFNRNAKSLANIFNVNSDKKMTEVCRIMEIPIEYSQKKEIGKRKVETSHKALLKSFKTTFTSSSSKFTTKFKSTDHIEQLHFIQFSFSQP